MFLLNHSHTFLKQLCCIIGFLLFTHVKAQTANEKEVLNSVADLIDNARFNDGNRILDSLLKITANKTKDTLLSQIYNFKGTICREEGKINDAIHFFVLAKDISERTNDQKLLAAIYVNLGTIYSGLSERSAALKYYFKAIAILKQSKNYRELAITYNNIGNIYTSQNQFSSSKFYMIKSMEAATIIGDSLTLAMVNHNMGSNMEATAELDSAIVYYKHSLNYLTGLETGMGHVYNYEHLGTTYFRLNKLNEAENYALKALNIAIEKGINGVMAELYMTLSKIYENKGEYKKSLEYSRLQLVWVDSVNSENSRSEIAKIEFDSELKQQKKFQAIEQKNREAINTAKLESKNKIIIFSLIALSIVLILVVFIFRGYRQKQLANQIISKQKHLVEEKQKEILDSINYAKRIQYTLLAHADFLKANIPNHFVYFNPKDIVSGDFYWATRKGNKFYLAVCDSTGHGVPGAFMCLLNIGFLSEAINEKGIEKPNEVFNFVRQRLVDNISKEGQRDGFDGILVCFEQNVTQSATEGPFTKITYAAANNAPVICQNNTLSTLESDRMPVGIGERKEDFKLYTLNAQPGDTLYLYTDGYADQFGGPKGKKFKYKTLNELLLANSSQALAQQHSNLKANFEEWRGDLEQVDDVCVVGICL
jgi:serine phosphatase RsbU (regulator of sigma subunit)